MSEQYFMDIPVYRCNIDKHTKEMKAEKNKMLQKIREPHEIALEAYQNVENYFNRDKWYSWQYNEVIGWIRLFVFGTQLRGEYWWIKANRINRGTRKKISFCGKAFELLIYSEFDSQAIFDSLIKKIRMLSKERPFKGRYIDLELLLITGHYINWRKLIDDQLSQQELDI